MSRSSGKNWMVLIGIVFNTSTGLVFETSIKGDLSIMPEVDLKVVSGKLLSVTKAVKDIKNRSEE